MRLLSLFRPSSLKAPAAALHAAVVTQSRLPAFYESGVPDTLDGRFDLICLHAFLVLHRLGPGALAQEVFDLLFADLERGLRETGVSDYSIGHKVKDMAAAFYGRIQSYDAALADEPALSDALARNLFRGKSPADATLPAMARYTIEAAASLAGQGSADVAAGRLRFPPFRVPVTDHA